MKGQSVGYREGRDDEEDEEMGKRVMGGKGEKKKKMIQKVSEVYTRSTCLGRPVKWCNYRHIFFFFFLSLYHLLFISLGFQLLAQHRVELDDGMTPVSSISKFPRISP